MFVDENSIIGTRVMNLLTSAIAWMLWVNRKQVGSIKHNNITVVDNWYKCYFICPAKNYCVLLLLLSDCVYYKGGYAENPNKQNYNSKQVIC